MAAAVGVFLFIPLIFLTNVNLMMFPEKWGTVHGFLEALVLPNVFPRYFEFLFAIENEIRKTCPIIYLNIWDDLPYPHWNAEFYASCDFIFNISKQTHNLVNIVLEENEYKTHDLDCGMPENFSNDTTYTAYIPHGINNKHIYKISDKSEVFEEYTKYTSDFKKETPTDFLVFWNNRNIRRKQPGDVILAFSKFCELLRDEDKASRCVLVMHTDPIDGNGTDFGTWCVECLKMWNEEGRLNNEELEQILTEHDIMKDALEMIASWNTKNTREAWMSLGIDKLVEVMKNDTEIARQALQELEEGEEE
jgi:hypothetical protein